MSLSPDDIAAMRAHLAKFPNQQNCPVCGNNDWTLSGPFVAIGAQQSVPVLADPAGTVMPFVSLTCDECMHVRQFAWMPIKMRLPRPKKKSEA